MNSTLIALTTGFVTTILLDAIWLGYVMRDFYFRKMQNIALIEDGKFQPKLWAAAIVYILISVGTTYFVLPKANGDIAAAFGWGCLMGLVLYGVYDMTNMSTLKDWTVSLALADIAWGVFVCGAVAAASQFAVLRFAN